MRYKKVHRGEVYMAKLGQGEGSVQRGIRPVVIIQNNEGNYYGPTTIVAPVTSKIDKRLSQPTHVRLKGIKFLEKESVVLCEQLKTIDKMQLVLRMGRLKQRKIKEINKAINVSVIPEFNQR